MLIGLAAAVIAATPATLDRDLRRAEPGDTVRLAAGGDFERILLSNREFSPPLTIDATGATVRGVTLRSVTGLNWVGGDIIAPPEGFNAKGPLGYGFGITKGGRVSFTRMRVSGWLRGMVFNEVNDFKVTASTFKGQRSDGINIAGSTRGLIDGNSISDFTPAPGDHPDAVQFWSSAGQPAVADVTVTNNIVRGETQGINAFGPKTGVRPERLTIRGNDLLISYPQGISGIMNNSLVTGNKVKQAPGAKYKVSVNANGTGSKVCDNSVPSVRNSPAANSCR